MPSILQPAQHNFAAAIAVVCVAGVVTEVLAAAPTPTPFEGVFVSGVSTTPQGAEALQLLDIARRQMGPHDRPEYDYQTIPMLFDGSADGDNEGLAWGGYWTQNSYGTAMTSLPLLDDVALHGMRESQNWWLSSMSNGSDAPFDYQHVPGTPEYA